MTFTSEKIHTLNELQDEPHVGVQSKKDECSKTEGKTSVDDNETNPDSNEQAAIDGKQPSKRKARKTQNKKDIKDTTKKDEKEKEKNSENNEQTALNRKQLSKGKRSKAEKEPQNKKESKDKTINEDEKEKFAFMLALCSTSSSNFLCSIKYYLTFNTLI